MPLSLLTNSVLLQERPDGGISTLDLDIVLGCHKGALVLGGSHMSKRAQEARLDGAILRVTFATKRGPRDAAIDLEACGVIRNDRLVVPPALCDAALNIKDTHALRTAFSTGHRSRLPSFAKLKKQPIKPWTECQIAEAQCLHHLAVAERVLLKESPSCHRGCLVPRILPGMLAGDRSQNCNTALVDDRTGFVRNYAGHFIREAPSTRPRDWASVFETARSIVSELAEPSNRSRLGMSPGVLEAITQAEHQLSMSCRLRRLHKDDDERRQRRRMRFNARLEAVADDLARLLHPPSTVPALDDKHDEGELP